MKYFLIGFMGSGKSSIGQQLSEKLKLKYIDLDQYIEKCENRSISDIFNDTGETYFRELEERCLKNIIKENNILVSTGGGTPTLNNLISTMNSIGETIYLQCCSETLYNRLQNEKKNRPMISTLSDENMKRYIENKLDERKFFYNKATHIINNDSGNCVNEIIKKLR